MSTPTSDTLAQLRQAHLVESGWLAEHLDDPHVRIVDMRGEVRSETDDTGYQTASYLGAGEA
ncbi:MAG TPA: hypothetical protein VK689_01445, partial [Armatimonadota bacterium]|nr:hypothetical protein [Armatimonadota bacterium]